MRSGAAIDDNIGKILDFLHINKLEENTVVIYCSDQGYFLGEHGFFDKRMIYEESMRMPFVIRYPKEIRAAERLDDIILNVDFPALFLDYAEVEKPDYMQGHSFRQNLQGTTPESWRHSMYYRYYAHQQHRPAHLGIRNLKYTLAFFYGSGLGLDGADNDPANQTIPSWEFYDLQEDPNQTRNAYSDPQYAPIIKEMKAEILRKRDMLNDDDSNNPEMQEILEKYWD